MAEKAIRVGVLGVGRGRSFARGASAAVGMELVALCDTWEERLKEQAAEYGVAAYTDFDRFLEHDMDAVVLANYFHEHAPFAIKALAAGKHVMSETTAASTMAECVALCEAVEKSGLTYMLAENYPYSAANQELRKLYREGEIGQVRYAEGEYTHAMEERQRLSISPGLNHWRNICPPTYYSSHALAPLMYITDTMPVSVNGLSIVEEPTQSPATVRVGDAGCVILVRTDNGAVFRIVGLMLSATHRVRYELYGETGLIGTADPNHWGHVKVTHEPWLCKPGTPKYRSYAPDWPEHAELAKKAGHGGGDFWTSFHFANAIRAGGQPYLDVYRAASMAAVAIASWQSCLEEGRPIAIPDFRDKAARAALAADTRSPFYSDDREPDVAPSIRGLVPPGEAAIARGREVWTGMGYQGN